jgi:NAD(P)-dependent dehydrogenase (short-subunit alcohol dehydrogenase family)
VDLTSAEETAKIANGQAGLELKNPVVAFRCDVAVESEIKAAIDKCVELFGS